MLCLPSSTKRNISLPVGLRLITNLGTTDVQEAKALNYKFNDIDIYSNSWGPQDSGFSVEGPQYLTKMALKNGAQKVSRVIKVILIDIRQ